ncbi:hypothetical protein [Streptomyces sp. AF1A]|jgi:hypothetical protein|uniref:hypothetical protein n=1 Tax=Streptomyces sp. AF1A TaxID=3394350 RepID=UPI0039BC7711
MSVRVRCRALDVHLADVVNVALAADRDTDAILATTHDAARAGRSSPSPESTS